AEERDAFFYGNIAADIIQLKAIGGHYNHCHRWTIIDAMGEHARGGREEAFVLGYLAHLAADTIAHNHFVPFHLTRFARTRGFWHMYWELSADRFIAEARWNFVTHLKNLSELDGLDELVNRSVPRKALSMRTNKLIFNHFLLISERNRWRRGVARLHPIKRLSLSRGFLRRFQDCSMDRIRLALRPRGLKKLLHIDTNGKAAQAKAMELRRRLVTRYPAGKRRNEAAAKAALPFLEGMQSPPIDHRRSSPHWD
ncbi:MAG: zinc dependent phospholipase C family protein, partial [Planctomycetota bacterium]|nr:zinc dependent phospholipase C family protein [Planctomycetota bacterium]